MEVARQGGPSIEVLPQSVRQPYARFRETPNLCDNKPHSRPNAPAQSADDHRLELLEAEL